MNAPRISYAPGDWALLARAGRALLVQASPGDPAVARLWDALGSSPAALAVLGVVEDVLPGAGCVFVHGHGPALTVAQRGVSATLDGEPVDAGFAPVVLDVPPVGATLAVSVGSGGADPTVPLETGIVPASGLVLLLDAPVAAPVVAPVVSPAAAALATVPIALPGRLAGDLEPRVSAPVPIPEPRQPLTGGPLDDPAQVEIPVTEDAADAEDAEERETVLAGTCAQGHLSGAYAPSCRVCGSPMLGHPPRPIPRPVLGALVLPNGTRVELDRGAVLGRAPQAQGDTPEHPHLVNLAAYGRAVSRQHLEVVVRGWNVAVRDLGSTNGTRVRTAGGKITTLEPGNPVPLAPGDSIAVADATTVVFEVTG